MNTLHLRTENEIAILEFNQPDSRVNVLGSRTMRELGGVIDSLASRPGVKALLITSAKDGIFIAGADIKEIESLSSTEEAVKLAGEGKEVLRRLSGLDIPTIAVINGACLGGGLELALACRYRTAGSGDRIRMGLPEVKLGIIPGLDGTQRLPRLIGLANSLGMILSGTTVSAKNALKYGLVDKLFADNRLLDDSIAFAKELLEKKVRVKPRKKKLIDLLLENTPAGRAFLFSRARSNVLKNTKGFYPAPLKAIEVIKRTYGGDIRAGSAIEGQALGELAMTDVSRNLVRVYFLNEEFKKFQWVSDGVKPAEVNKCAVAGAGVMGGGIAQLLAFHDIPARLKDINYDALKTALKTAKGIFDYAVKKRKLKPFQAAYKMGLISPTITYRGFENADLVIEAVVEDPDVKKKVFAELSRAVAPETVLVSNTSSIPIITMAEAAASPERVAGLHFFNPVNRMPLVEVIRSAKTSEQTLATVIAFARRIGKVVIVVNDVTGFLINRILLSYMNEAGFLLGEGVPMERIDRIARDFGMPMGPIELTDEVGVDVGYKVARILQEAYGPRMEVAPVISEVKNRGFFGKKTKAGFYLHGKKGKMPNPAIPGPAGGGRRGEDISDGDALKRMIYVMINEAARCLEEKAVDRPATVDIGMIMGTGFPPFRGGLLRYADSVGAGAVVRTLKDLEKKSGSARFTPCSHLINLADSNRGFYGTF